MPYIADYKTQYTSNADNLGFVIEEPPLNNVKAGDMLIMMWGASTDAEVELLDGFNLATHITSNEAIGSTNFSVGASNIFFQNGDVLQIGDEKVLITGGAGDNTFNVQRAYDGTTAVAHSDNEDIWKVDDVGGLGGADWKPAPKGCSTMDQCEAKFYYKYATYDGEQVSKWTCPVVGTMMYMFTAVVKGVHPTDPFIDANGTYYTGNANTQVSYPDLIATAKDQLALYVGSSDADSIAQGSHGNTALYVNTDVVMYQKISTGVGSMGAFEDTVPSDQTTAIGVLFRDDPANTIIPLQIAPSNSLTKIDADNTSDDTWMEAIYASGIDPKTGVARVDVLPSCEVVSTSTTWIFRIDNGGNDWVDNGIIDESVTFAGGATGTFKEVRKYQSTSNGRAYILIADYTGNGEPDNSSITGDTSGATALMYNTGSNYQIDVTNCFRTDVSISLSNYQTFKISGMSSLGITDGIYFIETTQANSVNEMGRWYRLHSHAERRQDGTLQTLSIGATTPTLTPYNMLNRAFTYVEGSTNVMTRGDSGNQAGWKTNYLGSFKSFTTPIDYSSTGIAVWSRHYNQNIQKTYFGVIDSSNGWKIWTLNSKIANGFQYATPEYRVFDLNSTETPTFQTASFDSANVKFLGFLVQATTDTGRDTMYMYDQYTLGLQTVRGGGADFGVPLADIEKFLAVEETLNGQSFTEGLKAYTPSMLVTAKTVRYSCYLGSSNQSLGFPPQADGISNFMYNADDDSNIFGLDFTDAKGSIASLITSDKGNFLKTGGTATIDLEGSTIANYNPTFQAGEVYNSVRFTGCGQVSGGATYNSCNFTGHTGDGAVLFDGIINGGTFSNNEIAVEIPNTGDYTLNNGTFSGNTFDIAVKDTVTTGTINLTTNSPGLTVKDDFTNTGGGVYTRGALTLNVLSPEITFTVSGLITGSIVEIYDNEIIDNGNNNTKLAFDNNSGTSFSYPHAGISNDVRVQVIKDGYEEIIQDFTLSNVDQSLNIVQEIETN